MVYDTKVRIEEIEEAHITIILNNNRLVRTGISGSKMAADITQTTIQRQ